MDSRILPPVGFCNANTQGWFFFPVSDANLSVLHSLISYYQHWMPYIQCPVDLDSIYRGKSQTTYRRNKLCPEYGQRSVFNLHSVSHQAVRGTSRQNAVIVISVSGLPKDNLIKGWIGHQHYDITRFWICPAARGDTKRKVFLEFSDVDKAEEASHQLLRATHEITIEKVSEPCSLSIQTLIKLFQSRLRHLRQRKNCHLLQPSSNCKYGSVTGTGKTKNATAWDIFSSIAYFQNRTIDRWCCDYAAGSKTVIPFAAIAGFPTASKYEHMEEWIRSKLKTQGATIKSIQMVPKLGRVHLEFECSLAGRQAAEHAVSVFDGLILAGQFLQGRLFPRKVGKSQQIQTQQPSDEPHVPIAYGSSIRAYWRREQVQTQQRPAGRHASIVMAHGSSLCSA